MFGPQGPHFRELLTQALSSTERGYDLLAPKFEHTPFRTPDSVLDSALPVLDEKPVTRALDLCCGTGAGMKLLRKLSRQSVWGLDRSQGMLSVASQLLSGPGVPVHLVRGDALQVPLRQAFDLITCFGAFGHVQPADEAQLIASIHALLMPEGRFVFFTAHPPSPLRVGYWVAKTFNAAMRVRNALIHPPFIMYYLTFLLPRATALLTAQGFEIEIREGLVPPPLHTLVLVVATRPKLVAPPNLR